MSDEDELPSTKLPLQVIRQKSVYVSRILFYGHQKSAAVLCSKECCVLDTMHVLVVYLNCKSSRYKLYYINIVKPVQLFGCFTVLPTIDYLYLF